MNEQNRPVKCLVVEDDKVTCELICRALFQVADCRSAASADEALTLIQEANNTLQPFDLICLDLLLPTPTGIDVLKYVRRTESSNNQSPARVIVISSLLFQETLSEAFVEGCDAFIAKPINRGELLRKLSTLNLIK